MNVTPDPEPTMSPDVNITREDVLADLLVGQSVPLTVPTPLEPRRPTLGGPAMRATVLAARVAVKLRLPLASRLLERLWFTPWVVGSSRPRPDGAHAFDVVHDDIRLSGWQVGAGPTVLLVHGWGGRSTDLGSVAAGLADAGYRAVAVDLPGHGASPGGMVDLFELTGALATVAGAAAPMAGIVAHSVGSVVSLLAMAEGVRAPRVVLLAPPATLAGAVRRLIRRAGLGDRGEPLLRARIERRYGHDVWDVLDFEATAPDVDAEVLVLHDVDDRRVPVGEGLRVARAFGAEPLLTAGLGHDRILDDEDVVSRVLDHVGDRPHGLRSSPWSGHREKPRESTHGESMARITPLSPPYEPHIAGYLEALMPPGVPPIGLFRTFVRNFPMASAMQEWGRYELGKQLSLSMREREIVIDRTCVRCRCEYEWGVHLAFFADRVGLDSEQITSLTHGDPENPCWNQREKLLIRAVDELHDTSDISETLWLRLADTFTDTEVLDLMFLCGWYHAISFVANAARVDLEDDAPRFLDFAHET